MKINFASFCNGTYWVAFFFGGAFVVFAISSLIADSIAAGYIFAELAIASLLISLAIGALIKIYEWVRALCSKNALRKP